MPSALVGAWHLDDTHSPSGAFIDPDGHPITDLYVAASRRAYTRASDGQLWLTDVDLDSKKHMVRIGCYFISPPTNYAWQFTDSNHLVLTSVAPAAAKPGPGNKPAKPSAPFTPAVFNLTKIPVPEHYSLLERGFHLIRMR